MARRFWPRVRPTAAPAASAISGQPLRSASFKLGRHMESMTKHQIPATLIPGDGIGPEVVAATVKILDALGSPFVWDVQHAGIAGVTHSGDPLPDATLKSIRKHKLALKGPLTTPIGEGFRSSNVRLREEFRLFANVRPVRTIVPGRYDKIDLVLVRENLGGFYVAHEYYIPVGDDPKAVAVATGVNTRDACERIVRFAFEYALKHGRKKITVVHKANILKALTGLFLEAARDVAREYSDRVEMNDIIVDACAMQLVLNPWQFDMLVSTNLFGDILSDQLAGLVGGLGMAPGANYGDDTAIFEAVHGSAPDIAGKGVANPISLLLASVLMLDHVGKGDLAERLRTAINETLQTDRICTRDLKGTASTSEFADAVVRRIRNT
ncbi:Isocitrate dehydrogenase [NADP] [Caballeronia sordidicola]|uniref:Isocitrate dehydrogenase [NADP] n=2 Tax=Caballeronia sordidicola TaxID=196367 RepID=A0A226X6D4_CABSO|nr:Isocitrate dehydrogenase [NADP] [Caballeronia sordidicola]